MQNNDLKTLTDQELKVRQKLMKTAVIMMGLAVFVMLIAGTIITVKKGFSAMAVTPICFLPLVIIFSAQLKKIKQEIKARESNAI